MTLAFAIKGKDGIVTIADKRFMDLSGNIELGIKMFRIPDRDDSAYVLALAGNKDEFEYVRDLFHERFVSDKGGKSKRLDKSQCRTILEDIRHRLFQKYNVDEMIRSGLKPTKDDQEIIMGVFAARVYENDKPVFQIYPIGTHLKPNPTDYFCIGGVFERANLLIKIGSHLLGRAGLRLSDVSCKLIAQAALFIVRYISHSTAVVSPEYMQYKLAEDECKPFRIVDVYPETIATSKKGKKFDYIPELIATVIEDIPADRLEKLMGDQDRFISALGKIRSENK